MSNTNTEQAPDWRCIAIELAGALDSASTQIDQMRGSFDDDDGAIQEAVDEIDAALDAYHSARKSDPLTPPPSLSADQQARQEFILKEELAEDAYSFATTVRGADIQALQKVVMERGEPFLSYCFALHVPGAEIPPLQQVIVESGTGWHAYLFANEIPGADTKALEKAVLASGNGLAAAFFAEFIPDADIKALERMVIEMGELAPVMRFADPERFPDSDKAALRSRLVQLVEIGADYADSCLERFDAAFPELVSNASSDDFLIPTAGRAPAPK